MKGQIEIQSVENPELLASLGMRRNLNELSTFIQTRVINQIEPPLPQDQSAVNTIIH